MVVPATSGLGLGDELGHGLDGVALFGVVAPGIVSAAHALAPWVGFQSGTRRAKPSPASWSSGIADPCGVLPDGCQTSFGRRSWRCCLGGLHFDTTSASRQAVRSGPGSLERKRGGGPNVCYSLSREPDSRLRTVEDSRTGCRPCLVLDGRARGRSWTWCGCRRVLPWIRF